jgi:FMN-binding protein
MALGAAAPVQGRVFMTPAQALAQAFPGARIERTAATLTPGEVRAVEQFARVKLTSPAVVIYDAWQEGARAGMAFFDRRVVRTQPAVLMVVVKPDTTVARIDILSFDEPPDYQPSVRWLGQFTGRHLDEGLWPQRDIRLLSGATLSSRAVTQSVRLALALARVLPPREAPR